MQRSTRQDRRNIAAALGGWSARHRKTAVFGWLLFVVLATVIGGAAGQRNLTGAQQGSGDSAQALQILDDAHIAQPAGEMVLVHSVSQTTGTPQFRATVADVVSAVRATGLTQNLREPYSAGLISADEHSALIEFDMTGDPQKAADRVQPVLDAVAKAGSAHPGIAVSEFGEASGNHWFNDTLGKDFKQAEWTAVPLALGILLVAFGALLAAILPVLLALTAFIAAIGLLGLASHLSAVDSSADSVMLLMGLAVGVDYCLFYLRREREERAAGRDRETALRIAAATSGRSVLVSGLTVMVAMAGMYLSGMHIFEGFATATILVVAIAMLGSVTVLPALLSMLGDRVEFGRLPGAKRRAARRSRTTAAGGGRVWNATLGKAAAHPRAALLGSAGFLLLLAGPAFGMHTEKLTIDQQVPQNVPLVQTYRQIVRTFPGGPAPAVVVLKSADIRGAAAQNAIKDFERAALRTGELGDPKAGNPIRVQLYPAAGVAQIQVPLRGDGTDAASLHALGTLRTAVVPQTLGRLPGAKVAVGGQLAFGADFNSRLHHSIVPVFAFVLAITFLLMLLAFRSPVIALTAIALNLLSVGAAYGVMTAIFQHGWGAALVGTQAPGAIESWLPLFVFVVLFGLSMDYHVFVVSRIREAREAGMTTERAVVHGLRSAAGTVTSAAVIMVAVFAVFGTLSMQDFKQLGVGLAVAVALDATVIRVLLLPATMILLGERNWPRSLRRAAPVGGDPQDAPRDAAFARLGRFGQPQAQDRAAVGMVGGRHGSAVGFGDLGDDGQP
ncbi:MMPL family transporter [Actinocrinis puniceicyclus]|uniref:MMPL family transporter n=1 Tax=Actinocrinis puniceicyclus TaxID=977794 RepID=UPI0028AE068F|nr:MMPL family transporter [Actinocrinis puniceicyclus]